MDSGILAGGKRHKRPDGKRRVGEHHRHDSALRGAQSAGGKGRNGASRSAVSDVEHGRVLRAVRRRADGHLRRDCRQSGGHSGVGRRIDGAGNCMRGPRGAAALQKQIERWIYCSPTYSC